MYRLLSILILAAAVSSATAQEEARTFKNLEGKTLTDTIVKYDFEAKEVTLDKSGKVPLATFSAEDQAYILHWNQVEGFRSTMRFKMEVKKSEWASMKHEQNVTPVYMDAIQIPGKKNPNHHVILVDDYEEYNAVYLQAEGYEIKLRNQNFFPIENIVVESKVYYEQELYLLTDSLFVSSESEYYDTVVTNKVRFLSETIPIIMPREEVFMNSESAITVDHQVERNALISTSESDEEDEEGDEEDEEEEETIEGFGDWDDHGRRRKGRVHGVWFRIGVKDPAGEMVWREITSPSSLDRKVNWEGFLSDQEDDEE
ncbi:hypothetical protein P4B35_09685 [Pontiellaceae bacterium B12227]|nr:hypothetical protein [Pontiellaceae bacterium B12227]